MADLAPRMRADLLGLRLFDQRKYRDTSAQPGGKVRLYRHFLAFGWQDGLDPNGWFSCGSYLRANVDVAEAGLNPWVHFIRWGRHELRALAPDAPFRSKALGPMTLEESLLQATRGLVDDHYYCGVNPDVAATGLTAADHFAAYGWKEGRAPAPWFNLEYLRTHAPTYRLGADNCLVDLLRLTTGAPTSVSAPKSWWIDPESATEALRRLRGSGKVLVVIHAYYADDLDVFSTYIKRLGPSIHIVLTCPANGAAVCHSWAERNSLQVTVVETGNRGRDWGPFLGVAREVGASGWEAILKLHTKRSPHRQDGAEWLQHLLQGLMPDQQVLDRIRSELNDERCDILAAPGTLASAAGWKPEGGLSKQLYDRYTGGQGDFSFPAGSMFWMSGRLAAQIAALPISLTNFEPELGQLDHTLAHAIERLAARLATAGIDVVRDPV